MFQPPTNKHRFAIVILALAMCLACSACQGDKGGATVTYTLGDEQSESAEGAAEPEQPGETSSDSADAAGKPDNDSAEADSPESTSAEGSDEAATTVALETNDVRVTMPATLAGECTWSQPNDEVVSCIAANGETICTVTWGETANHGGEAKGERHVIGEVSHGSIGLTAFFFTFGLDGSGKPIYAGLDEEPTSLATEYYLGASVDEVVSWIELASPGGWERAAIRDSSDGAADSDAADSANASPNAPFWGIWIGASQDAGEAQGIADAAVNQGFDAHVELTTDWSNLNSEPWYVVTVGYASTEEEANAQVAAVQSAGWDGAYVKYSGEHA